MKHKLSAKLLTISNKGGPLKLVVPDVVAPKPGVAPKTSAAPSIASPEIAELCKKLVRAQQLGDHLNISSSAASVEPLVNKLISLALSRRSSDLHLDPATDFLRIRERIDGVLVETHRLDIAIHQSLISRLKVMAELDITEKRQPQDGSFQYKLGDKIIDVRLSTLPTARGERAVLRLLDKSVLKVELSALGFETGTANQIAQLLQLPHGMILVTGPTGSGKTTSVYAMLSQINEIGSNIITVEDPIEYQFEMINQVEVQVKAGLGFAQILRNILRQDPDVIMVGEIRDRETADTAVRAALTGHLMISTLHTNDSVGAIDRLADMGIERFLLSSSLSAVISQRLLRVLCNDCKQRTVSNSPLLPKNTEIFEASPGGCDSCHRTGYLGRTVIAELLVIDEPIRRAIVDQKPAFEILQDLRSCGTFRSLRETALLKVVSGITSLDEAIKSTL
jgi:general secretion pathway protein E